MSELPGITLRELASRLKQKKGNGEPPTLFLGSRTGWFYGHEPFYEEMKSFSKVITTFDGYSGPEKFRECYNVLKSRRFTVGYIEDLLKSHLHSSPEPRYEDICIAEMIFGGYFDVIISTTIDSLLQVGLNHQKALQEVKELDNKLLILYMDPLEDLVREERRASKTIKIFGDLERRQYHTAQHELNLDDTNKVRLKEYLRKVLEKPTIVIGFDPTWDRPMEKVFSSSGGDIIYINEEKLDEKSDMAKAIGCRDGRWLIGNQWNYTKLMHLLHSELFSQEPLSFALARKLSEQLEIVQTNAEKREEEHKKQMGEMLQLVQTLQQDIGTLHTQMQLLQEGVQRLLDIDTDTERKDD